MISRCKVAAQIPLHENAIGELREMIAHPQRIGVWFGYPCGTFSPAGRHDGGPPPLRGTNGKDIMGRPHLVGKELARVTSANKPPVQNARARETL